MLCPTAATMGVAAGHRPGGAHAADVGPTRAGGGPRAGGEAAKEAARSGATVRASTTRGANPSAGRGTCSAKTTARA